MTTRLYVGGLSFDTTSEQLKTLFEQAGTVESATVVADKYSGRSRGFAFVEMSSNAEAKKAIEELSGKVLDGRTISVEEARPQQRSEGRSPGFDRGGGGRGGFKRGRGGGGRRW